MQSSVRLFFILMIGLFGGLPGAIYATDNDAQNCHLSSVDGNAIVITFDGSADDRRIFAPYAPQDFSVSANIPSGTYDVYLEAYDGHADRGSENQSREKFFVEFLGDGRMIARSQASDDVPDGRDDAFVTSRTDKNLVIDSSVSALQIVHAARGVEGESESVSPTCMMLLPQEREAVSAPVCGDSRIEGSEQCDDGNVTSGDGCSASCTLERNIIDPVCGNGTVEPGEVCDDGNADELSCTRQCTLPTEDVIVIEASGDVDECDGEIGNTIWNDINGNGIQDNGEEGISDVKVKLQYGDTVDTDRTNYRGRYKFDDLCEDTYRVIVASETLDDGCYPTYDRDRDLDHIHKVKLDEGEEYGKADFGYRCPVGSGTAKSSPATGPAALAVPVVGSASVMIAGMAAYMARRRTEFEDTIIPMD